MEPNDKRNVKQKSFLEGAEQPLDGVTSAGASEPDGTSVSGAPLIKEGSKLEQDKSARLDESDKVTKARAEKPFRRKKQSPAGEDVIPEIGVPIPGTPASRSARRPPESKLYQDEIYGTQELSPLGVAIVDTPEFQRLGHIYQLGFTYTVFRGANHRRFDHSVGTFFRVRTLLRRIVQNHARLYPRNKKDFLHPGHWLSPRLFIPAPGTPTEKPIRQSLMGRWRGLVEIVSASALLHDLGHVPAGHTLEDEFNLFEKHDGLGGSRFFQMFYGPRAPKLKIGNLQGPPTVDDFFEPLDEELLPRPETWQRVPLPWVFEPGT